MPTRHLSPKLHALIAGTGCLVEASFKRDIGAEIFQHIIGPGEGAHRESILNANQHPTKIGQSITLFVQVAMESERTDLYESAKRIFASAPEVQQRYYVTGEADFILVITVKTMKDYEALTRRLFFENNNVKHFRTSVAMDRVKVGMTVLV